jgi:hypothetical protein
MRKIACLFILGLTLLGYPASADAAGGRGGGSTHTMNSGGFRDVGFGGSGHFREGRLVDGRFRDGGFRGGGFRDGRFRDGRFRDGRFRDERFRSSFFFGVSPLWWDPWWEYPNPYYTQTPVVIEQPQEYIYQGSQTAAPNYWYFCQSSEGYFPYVKECPEGWMKVVPSPPLSPH